MATAVQRVDKAVERTRISKVDSCIITSCQVTPRGAGDPAQACMRDLQHGLCKKEFSSSDTSPIILLQTRSV